MAWRIQLREPPKDHGYIVHLHEDWTGDPTPEERDEAIEQLDKTRAQILQLENRYEQGQEIPECTSESDNERQNETNEKRNAPRADSPNKKARLSYVPPEQEKPGDYVEHTYSEQSKCYTVKVFHTVAKVSPFLKKTPFLIKEESEEEK
jgi:hypothetical protein